MEIACTLLMSTISPLKFWGNIVLISFFISEMLCPLIKTRCFILYCFLMNPWFVFLLRILAPLAQFLILVQDLTNYFACVVKHVFLDCSRV